MSFFLQYGKSSSLTIAIGEARGEARGIRGLVDILLELETPTDIIIDKIMQKFSLSEAKAKEFLP